MKRALVLTIAVIVALGLAQAAFAQDEPEVGLGTRVLSLAGSYQLDHNKAWNVAAGYGQFISDKIEVGGVVGFSGNDDSDNTVGFLGAAGKYHFISDTPSRTIPYVGVVIAMAKMGSETGFGYGAQAGLDMFLSAKQAVFLEYSWMATDAGGSTDYTSLINFGIRQYL
jgi:hypothetical protein